MLLFALASSLLKTYVILYGYTQGLVPLGLPELSYWHIFGLHAMVNLVFTGSAELRAGAKDNEEGSSAERLLGHLFVTLICWAIFAIVF